MKTIAILNLKGGTAKTVTAATMARCLSAEYSESVVLIDADQQGNLSQYFGITDTSQCGNTWRLLTEGAGYWPDFVTPISPTLDLIPSGMELARADLPNSGAKVTEIEDLRTALAEDGVQYLIIDLPPSLGLASQAALLAADEVIIPIRLDVFSTAGMAELTVAETGIRASRIPYANPHESPGAPEHRRTGEYPDFQPPLRRIEELPGFCAGVSGGTSWVIIVWRRSCGGSSRDSLTLRKPQGISRL